MKFKTTTKIIKDYVLTVSKAVDIKPSTPALQGLYIKIKENNCELTGSDLDLVIKANFEVESIVDGECLVNSRIFSEVMRKLPSGEVVFSDIGNEIKVETKKTEYRLRKLDHLTYPKTLLEQQHNTSESKRLKTTSLFEALKKVGVAASPEGGKPIPFSLTMKTTKQTSFQPIATGLQPTPSLIYLFLMQELFHTDL